MLNLDYYPKSNGRCSGRAHGAATYTEIQPHTGGKVGTVTYDVLVALPRIHKPLKMVGQHLTETCRVKR
jgi:hypothetical protein